MYRRRVSLLALSGALVAGLATPSFASQPGSRHDLVDRYTRVVYELERRASPTLVLKTKATVVDTTGRVLDTSVTRTPVAGGQPRAAKVPPFACVNDRDRRGFRRHPAWELLDRSGNEFVHFQYFPYSQEKARIREGQFTQQWMICATGGVDAENGSRITVSGPAVAYRSAHQTYKIGQIWREGKTPEDHTVSLGFQAGKGPVRVSGSIQQTPTQKLKGSPLAPFHENHFARNQVAGWWEHGCRPVCRRWNGSADFQGSVAEALFEFPDAMAVAPHHFSYSAAVEHFCSNPAGCRG